MAIIIKTEKETKKENYISSNSNFFPKFRRKMKENG